MTAVPDSDLPDSFAGKSVPETDMPGRAAPTTAAKPAPMEESGWGRVASGLAAIPAQAGLPFRVARGLIEEGPKGGVKAAGREAQAAQDLLGTFTYDPSQAQLSEPGVYAREAGKAALLAELPAIGIGATIGGLTGGVPGAIRGGATAALTTPPLAAGGGVLSQAARDIGLGPGYQTLAGAMPLPGQRAVVGGMEKGLTTMERVIGHFLETRFPGLAARMAPKPASTTPPSDILLGGRAPSREAEAQVGESMGRGVATATAASGARTAETQAAIEQRAARELQQERDRIARLQLRTTAAEKMQEKIQEKIASEASGLSTTAPSEFGFDVQGRLIGRKAAVERERDTQYKAKLKDFLDFARGEQRAGRFWQDSPAGKAAISEIESMMKPTAEMGAVRAVTTEQEKAIKAVLDEVRGSRKVTVTEPYPETKTVSEPVDVMVVDSVIRKLGEAAAGRPPTGYEAIGQKLALKMRNSLRNGMENYAGVYGEAKTAYRDALKLLDSYNEGPVAKVTATSANVRDRLTTDPQKIGDMLFKSPQSVSDLIDALGDRAAVVDLGKQFLGNKLASFEGNVAKTENWLNKPQTRETLDALGIKSQADDYLTRLKSLEAEGEYFKRRGEELGKGVTGEKIKAGKEAIITAEQKAIEQVRTSATKYERDLADMANVGDKQAAVRLEKLLNTGNPSSIRRVGRMLDAQGKAAMPDAIRQYIARSSPGKLADNWDKTKRLIEGGRLMTPAQIANLDTDVMRAIEAMGKQPTQKQINQVSTLIASRLATIGATAYGASRE